MKVLFLTQTGTLGPSSRYRVYQLLPLLEQMGFQCMVAPLREPRRWRRANDCDIVVVQKGLLPGLPALMERWLAAGKPVVFDFDDAIWLPRVGGNPLLRLLHRERCVQGILRSASAVIAGNDFLAEYAARFNRNVSVVPTCLDTTRYPKTTGEATVGWIGSRTTLPYLATLKPVFERLNIKPRIIASGSVDFPAEFRPWSLETELEELAQIGIGIAPLPDTPWERGKCAVKILQYMACAMAVVASPVGVQKHIIRHSENGLLAGSESEWLEHLTALLKDTGLRARLGAAARQTVEKSYHIRQAAEKVAGVLCEAKAGGRDRT